MSRAYRMRIWAVFSGQMPAGANGPAGLAARGSQNPAEKLFDPRGSRQMDMQTRPPGWLPAGIKMIIDQEE